ncbi:hypothetical protein LRAMOSA01933 [Lichtheimia ramosa]|uniref:F-box domain-containing protein n=1 Tax=Lichtheimia ramosa TaxID=688394 RepID=A0A077WLM8_9FUNG|nr:hypothetical protein LRAMOSA01933 [Lichtheimia ramosa]
MSSRPDDNPRFPAELLIAVFTHLDGRTLATCSAVCRQWYGVINNYDDLLWRACAKRDFHHGNKRRFWSLHFPDPQVHNSIGHSQRTWQDMYRISRNWFTGNCMGFFPKVDDHHSTTNATLTPHVVVGTPQEHTFFTTLTVTSTGHIVRSNPTYRRPDGHQSIQIQSPESRETHYLDQPVLDGPGSTHTVFCHYSHPSSKWLVTGSLDGTVALWDVVKQQMVHLWEGHRGRVLCVGMNDDVVVSGGSDSMLRVWDLADHHLEEQVTTARRGMIDISSYLSASSDWIQGVGEIAVGEHLVACSPDASGPVLVFSLLTGSLVYELGSPRPRIRDLDWGAVVEEMTGFTKLCLVPYFLLTKGKLPNYPDGIPVLPSPPPPPPTSPEKKPTSKPRYGYIASLDESPCSPPPPAAAQMTPYQLYRYYQSINASSSSSNTSIIQDQQQQHQQSAPSSSSNNKQIRSCINVWDLETGDIVYRLAPQLDTGYIITDIRASPDSSKVFACVEIRTRHQRQERLYCWDFSSTRRHPSTTDHDPQLKVMQIDGCTSSSTTAYKQSVGNSWACFM